MSGFEVLGIVASVIQIADVGARLSVKLLTFSHKVKNADANIKNISNDVALTCSVLRELGENLKKDEQSRLCNENAVKTAEGVVKECMRVFEDLDGALDGKLTADDEKKSLFKKIGRGVKFSLVEPQIELMRSNLERLKSTLHLMLQVIIYARKLRSKAKTEVLQEQQAIIKSLHAEKQANDLKFDKLMKAIEGLDISKDESRPLKQVKTNDSTYSSQHNSIHSSVSNLDRQDSANDSVLVNLAVTSGTGFESQTVSRNLEEEQEFKPPQTLPTPSESSEDLSHYMFLVKNLLHEVELLQYKLDHTVRGTFRESIKEAHVRTTDKLAAKHGHERIFRVFSQAWREHASGPSKPTACANNESFETAARLVTSGLIPRSVLSAVQQKTRVSQEYLRSSHSDPFLEGVLYRPPHFSEHPRHYEVPHHPTSSSGTMGDYRNSVPNVAQPLNNPSRFVDPPLRTQETSLEKPELVKVFKGFEARKSSQERQHSQLLPRKSSKHSTSRPEFPSPKPKELSASDDVAGQVIGNEEWMLKPGFGSQDGDVDGDRAAGKEITAEEAEDEEEAEERQAGEVAEEEIADVIAALDANKAVEAGEGAFQRKHDDDHISESVQPSVRESEEKTDPLEIVSFGENFTHRISKARKGERAHVCEFTGCNKVFTRAEHRRRHELTHSPEADFSCPNAGCCKAFHRPDLLARHVERHELGAQRESSYRYEGNPFNVTTNSGRSMTQPPMFSSANPQGSENRVTGTSIVTPPMTTQSYAIHSMPLWAGPYNLPEGASDIMPTHLVDDLPNYAFPEGDGSVPPVSDSYAHYRPHRNSLPLLPINLDPFLSVPMMKPMPTAPAIPVWAGIDHETPQPPQLIPHGFDMRELAEEAPGSGDASTDEEEHTDNGVMQYESVKTGRRLRSLQSMSPPNWGDVNPKQYRRMVKRREMRHRLGYRKARKTLHEARVPYLHPSESRHAMRRPRDANGRFLTWEEMETLSQGQARNAGHEGQSKNRYPARRSHLERISSPRSRIHTGEDAEAGQALKAAVAAAADEAFRTQMEPDESTVNKTELVTADMPTANIGTPKSKRDIVESAPAGLATNRIVNSPRSRSQSRGRESRRRDSGGQGELAERATSEAAATSQHPSVGDELEYMTRQALKATTHPEPLRKVVESDAVDIAGLAFNSEGKMFDEDDVIGPPEILRRAKHPRVEPESYGQWNVPEDESKKSKRKSKRSSIFDVFHGEQVEMENTHESNRLFNQNVRPKSSAVDFLEENFSKRKVQNRAAERAFGEGEENNFMNLSETHDLDDKRTGSPLVQAQKVNYNPEESPPPFLPAESPVLPTDGSPEGWQVPSKKSKKNKKKRRSQPSQGDAVLISYLAPGAPDIARPATEKTPDHASGLEAEETNEADAGIIDKLDRGIDDQSAPASIAESITVASSPLGTFETFGLSSSVGSPFGSSDRALGRIPAITVSAVDSIAEQENGVGETETAHHSTDAIENPSVSVPIDTRTPPAPTSTAPPFALGPHSAQGTSRTYRGPNEVTQDKLKLPLQKKRKPNSQASTASTPAEVLGTVTTSSPQTLEPASPKEVLPVTLSRKEQIERKRAKLGELRARRKRRTEVEDDGCPIEPLIGMIKSEEEVKTDKEGQKSDKDLVDELLLQWTVMDKEELKILNQEVVMDSGGDGLGVAVGGGMDMDLD